MIGLSDRAMRKAAAAALWLAVAGGILARLYIMWRGQIDSDEAIVGLMGMEILKGRNFVFFWGQSYMGSLEAYGAAALFFFFGASPFILKMVPFLFFLITAALHFLLVRRLVGKNEALLCLGLLFVSPWTVTVWTFAPRGGYMEALAFGTAAMLAAASIAGEAEAGLWPRRFILGLLAGLGFWTNYFVVFYLVPIFLVVVLPDLLKGRPAPKLAALSTGFLIGVSPVIIHNIRHPMAILDMAAVAKAMKVGDALFNLFVRQLPTLVGGNKLSADGPLWTPVSLMHLTLYLAAAIYYPLAVVGRKRRLGKFYRPALLFFPLMILTALLLFAGTGFGAFNTPRYLIPIYPLLAACLAILLGDLWRRVRAAALPAAFLVIAVHVWGNVYYFTGKYLPEAKRTMGAMARIIDFCRENGVTRAYAGHWRCYLLTFLSRQELIVADVDRLRYLPFQQAVAESPAPAIIAEAYRGELTATLKAIGYRFTTGIIDRYTVFANPMLDPGIGASIEQRAARVIGTGGGDFDPLPGGGVISAGPQKKWLEATLDIGSEAPVNGLILSPGRERTFYPRQFRVETSLDGRSWRDAVEVGPYVGGIYHMRRLRYEKNGWVSVYFEPRRARFIKVVLRRRWPQRRWALDKAWISLAAAMPSS